MVKKKTATEVLKSSAKRQPPKGRGKQPKRMKKSDRILYARLSRVRTHKHLLTSAATQSL